jgi:hypothetical protein
VHEYEGEYSGSCWDFLFFSCKDNEASLLPILDGLGAEVSDRQIFKAELLGLFESLHERGIIRPKPSG